MASTTNWAFPYPVLTDTPDVPRDFKAQADRMELFANNGFHEQVIGPYSFTAQNTFTNQTVPANFPVAADDTALTMSFTKFASSTKLILEVIGSGQLSAGTAQSLLFVVRVGTTDYDVARYRFASAAPTRNQWGGKRQVTGIPAGTYTCKLRFYAATASGVDFFPGGDDSVSYTVREIS